MALAKPLHLRLSSSIGSFLILQFRTNPEAVDMLRVIELSVRKKQKLYSVNEAFDINPDFGSIAERENKILKK